ncbi:nucleotide exchange factor GrpE [Endozoicomonas sp. SM1973]|uniref:Protein GrpE n=1 Tax=Spartinivicinus marinus TaxID=2994442 RepID=A0A853IDW2_9GAMM|nr:nucleotide exchange factor GrpE [Spartinivicinus marinus]MCX4027968.1 nucleotide exchange factor GrpE [Spartinivicinus marinus]NYZ68244.1 nucleotide exchange factor GrpE [Spartinivicinus marinus]
MSEEKSVPNEQEEVASNDQVDTQQAEELGAGSDEISSLDEQAQDAASLEALQQQLGTALAEANEAKEHVLRAQAEMQNVQRRAKQDVEKAHKFALDKFSNELLPVVDSLERALETATPTGEEASKAMHEGIELTLKMFLDVLKKFNIEQLDPVGEPFDPQFHEAMAMQESQDAEPGTVLAAIQKGYTLNGRLVRPAMVVVSKASATKIDEKA